jgi:DNA polymerase-1
MLTVSKKDLECVDWANLSLDKLALGNALDCDFTLRVFDKIEADLTKEGRPKIYDAVLAPVLMDFGAMEYRGMRIDEKALDELDKQLSQMLIDLEKECMTLSPIPDINIKSPKDLIVVLFTSAGFDLTPTRFNPKSTMPSTDAKVCQTLLAKLAAQDSRTELEEKAIPFLECLLKFRKRDKQYSTYVTNIKKTIKWNGKNRNHPSYNFSVVVTGRLSCSNTTVKIKEQKITKKTSKLVNKTQLKGVGFHTLPRVDDEDPVNLRNLFISDEGKLFIAADFSTAELRMLAYQCRDKNLISAFLSGEDLHKFTASLVFKKPVSEITKEERQIAKSISFLIVYGGGPSKLSLVSKKPKAFCKQVFQQYFKAFPGVVNWINATREQVGKDGYAESLFGRKRHLLNVYSPNIKYRERALRQGVNFKIQSPVSDMLVTATYRINRLIEKTGIDLETLANVHDSYEGQVTPENLEKAIYIIRKGMTDLSYYNKVFGIDFDVPFTIDIEVGKSFGSGTHVEFVNDKVSNLDKLLL